MVREFFEEQKRRGKIRTTIGGKELALLGIIANGLIGRVIAGMDPARDLQESDPRRPSGQARPDHAMPSTQRLRPAVVTVTRAPGVACPGVNRSF